MSDLFVALVVSLIAWGGVFLMLLRLEARIRKLEREVRKS